MNAANMLTSLRDSFSQMGYYVMISALLLLLSCPARARSGVYNWQGVKIPLNT